MADLFADRLRTSDDVRIVTHALFGLMRYGGQGHLETLRKFLDDPKVSERYREWAKLAIEKILQR